MKKSWLLFSLSYCFLSVQAQFHTIAYSKSLYKVEEVAEQMETKSLPENGEADTPVSLISMAGKQSEEMRSHWIGCYMSVSYPLKKIIVTSPYGRRKDPFTGKRRSHNGLDLRARNEEVYAMMPGEVVKVSSDKRSGNYVAIHHGDYTVSYCHLSKALVKKGAQVLPGEVVAISGNTGRSTAPHLHITAKYGKKHIDPAILLQFVKETREEALAHLVAGN
ncbi:M23 family metallopeptidase [Phocaeicola barnesiae]|uniref:M23 family metallopeptidase n=1 Tax=Phocaeicola barnesiae TaxID=376804 RepID=UPI0025A3B0E4|nr:M23 family metallopeptidase [Phocaeicola barnesiae]MDM8233582.1 M23 family metallopeptidase [Phocaeicola barnesiae]